MSDNVLEIPPDESKTKNRRALFIVLIGSFVTVALLFAASALFSIKYFYINVHGESMIPVFQSGDTVVFEKVKKPVDGDFIVFNLPKAWEKAWKGEQHPRLIKRLALGPGDVLSWDGSNWYKNGDQFSYVKTGTCKVDPTEVILGPDEYFVTGDTTTGKTLDSREAFCRGLDYLVPQSNVVHFGKVKKVF